ncbi:DNA-binding protein [Pseudodesulfovibrio sp.]|uniref:baseplate complex protein n=1 Tax=unclassified Pseudodesulfovibrio TaxID=2661612 RepID=UPI003B00208D
MNLLRLNDYNVPGHQLIIGGSMPIKAADASGETSSTDEVDKGTKAKKLTVSLVIKFQDMADLKQLTRVAEAKTNGERKVYTITNSTANAMGIRQVRFAENFSAQEKDGLRAWDVSFTLKEYLSNPERVEQREKKPEPVAQTSDGTTTKENKPAETAQAVEEPATFIEKVLKVIDEALA